MTIRRASTTDLPNASQNGQAHLAYFDERTQASFVWDGKADLIEVSLGGYGEPVDHIINPHPAGYESQPFWEGFEQFEQVCREHAATLETYR